MLKDKSKLFFVVIICIIVIAARQFVLNPKLPAQKTEFLIIVFGWQRYASLKRLCDSLLKADYMNQRVDLQFSIDGMHSTQVKDYVEKFHWPFGNVHLKISKVHLGLEKVLL